MGAMAAVQDAAGSSSLSTGKRAARCGAVMVLGADGGRAGRDGGAQRCCVGEAMSRAHALEELDGGAPEEHGTGWFFSDTEATSSPNQDQSN